MAYGRFVPHELLELLNKRSILEVELGDQVEQEMAVLFSDIRSFTTLSESMTPSENFQFINAYPIPDGADHPPTRRLYR